MTFKALLCTGTIVVPDSIPAGQCAACTHDAMFIDIHITFSFICWLGYQSSARFAASSCVCLEAGTQCNKAAEHARKLCPLFAGVQQMESIYSLWQISSLGW